MASLTTIRSLTGRLASRARWERTRLSNQSAAARIESLLRTDLTYLDRDALLDLHDSVARIEKEELPGILLEAGTARGGSALVIAAAKAPGRPLYLYDTFGLIPPPSERDGADVQKRYEVIAAGQATGPGGSRYYGYEEDLLSEIQGLFSDHGYHPDESGIHFVQGLYEDTLHPKEPVALAHIDSDWYESVTTCLERVVPHLVVGGRLIIDDYETWSGARDAVDDYFADRRPEFAFESRARLHVVRTAVPAG